MTNERLVSIHPHRTPRNPPRHPTTLVAQTLAQPHRAASVMSWATSNRRQRLPRNWATIRDQVKRRAKGQCEAHTHAKQCDGTGTDADHIIAGDNHGLSNLQWLSAPCHKAKTAAETSARNKARNDARQRTEEQHPGRRT